MAFYFFFYILDMYKIKIWPRVNNLVQLTNIATRCYSLSLICCVKPMTEKLDFPVLCRRDFV